MQNYNETIKNILKRRAVREYSDRDIEDWKLELVLEAGRWAPTGLNMQLWRFVVIKDKDLKREIGKHAKFLGLKSPQVANAPVIIVVCSKWMKSKFNRDDCIFAGANIILAATSLGLASCWVGGVKEDKIKKILNLPHNYAVIGIITLGYSSKDVAPPAKLELNDIVFEENRFKKEKFNNPFKWGPLSVIKKIVEAQRG